MHLEIGESFTFAVNDDLKLFSWGLNDRHQLGRAFDAAQYHFKPKFAKIFQGLSPRLISSGDDHTLMVDYSDNVYIWGGNGHGQLGIGHTREIRSIVKLDSISGGVLSIASKGSKNYIVSAEGKILEWPHKGKENKYKPLIARVSEPFIKFTNISCGSDFAVAINDIGLVFSKGNNSESQLGHGDKRHRETFTLIEQFREIGEKIAEVSCGCQHTISRTSNGKIYTWGAGKLGQLGTGSNLNVSVPVHIQIQVLSGKKIKVQSVQAGFLCSYALLETGKIYHTGTNAFRDSNNSSFKNMPYKKKVYKDYPTDDFLPLRLYCKWSRTVSLCYLTVCDFRKMKINRKLMDTIVQKVNTVWNTSYNQGKLQDLLISVATF